MGVSFWMVRTCVRVLQKRGCNDVSAMMCGDGEGDVDGEYLIGCDFPSRNVGNGHVHKIGVVSIAA